MNPKIENSEFITLSNQKNLSVLLEEKPLNIFSDLVIQYLDNLSFVLRKNPKSKNYSDVTSFAFFCRKANINRLKAEYLESPQKIKKGRGLAFHICPSNVPVNFAFSFVAGLLAGNANLIRVPNKFFHQVQIVIDEINKLNDRDEFKEIVNKAVFIKYEKKNTLTEEFSKYCDARIIWGGDQTINQIRKYPIGPNSIDLCFADKKSLCLIDAKGFLDSSSKNKVAKGFFNDAYLFDQNACTAPKIIVWRGCSNHIQTAKKEFWSRVYKIALSNYALTSKMAIDKLFNLYNNLIKSDTFIDFKQHGNLIYRTEVSRQDIKYSDLNLHFGHFLELEGDLSDLREICSSKFQTLSYFGMEKEELFEFILESKIKGIDRIVPIGKTMDFSLIWDGYDMINMLSREITII